MSMSGGCSDGGYLEKSKGRGAENHTPPVKVGPINTRGCNAMPGGSVLVLDRLMSS